MIRLAVQVADAGGAPEGVAGDLEHILTAMNTSGGGPAPAAAASGASLAAPGAPPGAVPQKLPFCAPKKIADGKAPRVPSPCLKSSV